MIIRLYILAFTLLPGFFFAQEKVDSFHLIWNNNSLSDSIKFHMINRILEESFTSSPDSAIKYTTLIQDFALERNLLKQVAKAAYVEGLVKQYTGDLIDASNALNRSLKIYEKFKDKLNIAHVLNGLGMVYWTNGEYIKSIKYYERSRDISIEINAKDIRVIAYSGIAYSHYQQGQFARAITSVRKMLELSKEIEDEYHEAWAYGAIGAFYLKKGDYEKVIEYNLKATEINKKINNPVNLIRNYAYIGEAYLNLGNEEKAKENYQISLKISEQENDKRGTAFSLKSLSNLLKRQKRFDEANEYLTRSLSLAREIKNRDMEVEYLTDLGLIQFELGNYNSAIDYCQESSALSQRVNSVDAELRACECLYKSYKITGNDIQSLLFHEKMMSLQDSINKENIASNLQEFEFEMELMTDSITQAYKAQQIDNIHQAEIEERNRQILLLIAGILIVAVIAGFLVYINSKNRQLNQNRIEVIKKEQEALLLKAMIEGEEKERKRLAMDLHDGLGTTLATVKMQISGMLDNSTDKGSSQSYLKAEVLIDDACKTVREISHDLMPYVLEQQGLISAINDLCQKFQSQNEIEFDFIHFGEEESLNDILKITVFRITQELLKNIIKHAQANEVIVQLTIEKDELILIVEDNGKGFDIQATKSGIGLENIQSRSAYLGGKVEINSSENEGSSFMIQFPINSKKKEI